VPPNPREVEKPSRGGVEKLGAEAELAAHWKEQHHLKGGTYVDGDHSRSTRGERSVIEKEKRTYRKARRRIQEREVDHRK